MTLQQLHYAIVISETGSMNKAAEKLYISVYQDDDEAYDIWTKTIGIAPDHMVRFGKEDNFWEHGSGPCGPCSEIYFDRGPEHGCGKPDCHVGCECDRFMEVWNLVFSQYDSDGKGNYALLERPNIDTGMGLERLACVMQGVGNLFEVDTVQALLHHVERVSGKTYGLDDKTDISILRHLHERAVVHLADLLPEQAGEQQPVEQQQHAHRHQIIEYQRLFVDLFHVSSSPSLPCRYGFGFQ